MTGNNKKKIILITSIVIIFILLFGAIFHFFYRHIPTYYITSTTPEDNGYWLACDLNLMKTADYEIKNTNMAIKEIFFDGLRTYIVVDGIDKSDQILKAAINDQKNNKYISNHNFSISDSLMVFIFDNYKGSKEVQFCIELSNKKGCSDYFNLNSCEIESIEPEEYFEEILLNSITKGKTSTLINIDLYIAKSVEKFQIESKNEVRTCQSCKSSGTSYSILFPMVIDTEETFVIHALDNEGFLILSIPIDLEITK